ncbi:hypothetical protein KAJ02_00345 [Candidatus Bipolaricaulota bacterium]|nr:hypothetical protein [Candidatus Bipolaricaulota bacterium]
MEIPQYYSDGIELSLTMPWTVALTFSVKDTTEDRVAVPQAIVRMSPEHAKVAAMLLRKILKQYEEESKSPINLPDGVFQSFGLSQSDW